MRVQIPIQLQIQQVQRCIRCIYSRNCTSTNANTSSKNVHLQAELYNEYAAEDKLLNFQEFYELYKVERSKIEVRGRPYIT